MDPEPTPARPLSAAFVTILPDVEKYVAELASNLPLWWTRFNQWHDYPLLVFSEGLRGDTKRRLIRASQNRIWFFLLEDLLDVPADITSDSQRRAALEKAQHVTIGYRAQARWKAGPMFKHPVFLAGDGIDYLWWLDYDSYLPCEQRDDPFLYMRQEEIVFAFTHWGVDARASSRNFWEYTRLYMDAVGMTPTSNAFLRSIHNEQGKYHGRIVMNDNELLDVRWFAGESYQTYFQFIDDLQGIWEHRWGDHLIRTFGAAIHLEDGRSRELPLPYAHQDVCLCGSEPGLACAKVDDAKRPRKGWRWECSEA